MKELSALAGFSTGFGLFFRALEVAYAWAPMSELGDVHHVSLVIKFGPDTTANLAKAKEAPTPQETPVNKTAPALPPPSLERGSPEGPFNRR
jgi:hypothetical protein